MAYSEKAVLEVLSTIKDPARNTNLVSAGRIGDLSHADGHVRLILKIDPAQADVFAPVQAKIEDKLKELGAIR